MEFLIFSHPLCPAYRWAFLIRQWRRAARALFMPLALLALLGTEASPAQVVSHEYELKAVFLFNFAKFTEWPTNAFHDADQPFVIGVLGANPFGNALEAAVEHETYEGRRLVIKYFSRIEDVRDCQILFIGPSESRQLEKILDTLKDRPILTVSEVDNAVRRGVCVRFFTENNKIRLRINLAALKATGLAMSSQLLSLAETIPGVKK